MGGELIATGENSNVCLEGCRFPAADSYINLQSIYTLCLEGTDMVIIPTLCACGCNEVVWNGTKYRQGHNSRVQHGMVGKHPVPWNKGKKHRKESIVKMRDANKGKHLSLQTEFKKGQHPSPETEFKSETMLGGKNPFFGKNHTAKSIQKMIRAHNNISDDTRQKMSKSHIGLQSGEKSPHWKGGISFEPYCPKFNKTLKERTRERDNRTCQLCGERENGQKLSVHHVHYDKENCAPDLISLCLRCNSKVNANRDYYENLFIEKLRERGLIL